jgi:NADH dehydrogenase (ubiquinone) 1 alpha subcomplex subunit 6
MRSANEIVTLYAINIPASAVKAKIRQEFERNSRVDDLATVDILLLKGHQEYQVSLSSISTLFQHHTNE